MLTQALKECWCKNIYTDSDELKCSYSLIWHCTQKDDSNKFHTVGIQTLNQNWIL